jgi:hypothetical protein
MPEDTAGGRQSEPESRYLRLLATRFGGRRPRWGPRWLFLSYTPVGRGHRAGAAPSGRSPATADEFAPPDESSPGRRRLRVARGTLHLARILSNSSSVAAAVATTASRMLSTTSARNSFSSTAAIRFSTVATEWAGQDSNLRPTDYESAASADSRAKPGRNATRMRADDPTAVRAPANERPSGWV